MPPVIASTGVDTISVSDPSLIARTPQSYTPPTTCAYRYINFKGFVAESAFFHFATTIRRSDDASTKVGSLENFHPDSALSQWAEPNSDFFDYPI